MSTDTHPDDKFSSIGPAVSNLAAANLDDSSSYSKAALDAIKPSVSLSSNDKEFLPSSVPSHDSTASAPINSDSVPPDSVMKPQGIRSRWAGSEPVSKADKPVLSKRQGRNQRILFLLTLVVVAPILAVGSAILSDKRFSNAISDPLQRSVLLHIIGKNFQSSNNLGVAKYFYEESFKLHPDTCCLIDIGLMKNQMGDNEAAKADYLKSITMQPQARAYNNLGTIYNNEKHEDKAIEAFTESLRIDPHWVLALDNRGATYAHQKKFDLAIKDLSSAIKLGYARSYYSRYRAYIDMGRKDLAERDNQIIQRHKYTDTTFCFMPPPKVSEQ